MENSNGTKEIGTEDLLIDSGVSLQDAFSKFRSRKISELKLARFNKGETLNRTAEYKANLRQAFIQSCMNYLGVPYSKRYKEEGADDAPLYLDCCGLVRRAVQDNQEQFGFIIGRWNQAYQIDTLPIVLEEKDLQPGDLIFYEGTYTSSRSKPQKHDMVHVEVFLGGETTIGARMKRGVISVFPSYKFESTSWTLVKYHFRSIDTWLDGQCISHCSEHAWLEDAAPISAGVLKGSVFYEEPGDESAGDDSDEDEQPEHSSPDQTQATIVLPPLLKADSVTAAPTKTITSDIVKLDAKSKSKSYMGRKSALTYYVNKSNGWGLVKTALDKRGWQQLPFENKFTTKYDLKWVERKSDIDYRAHTEGQLVCHFPNNECITTKVQLLRTMRECFSKVIPNKNERTPVPWLPETYDLEAPADCQAVLQAEEKCIESTGTGATWIYKPPCNNRGRGIRVLRGKDKLQEVCFPPVLEKSPMVRSTQKGILQRYIENPLLVCVNGERFKFDIRCYLLIATSSPSFLCYYHPGYCRLSLKPFSMDENALDDAAVHLTNAAIQKKEELYSEKKEMQIQLPEALAQLCDAEGNFSAATYLRTSLDTEIKSCMKDVLRASLHKLTRKHGYFDLLGFDFMVTADNELKLLEINTNPAMSLDNSTLESLLPNVIDGALQIVLDTQGPEKLINERRLSLNTLALPGQYELLYDEVEESKKVPLPPILRKQSSSAVTN